MIEILAFLGILFVMVLAAFGDVIAIIALSIADRIRRGGKHDTE